MSTVREAIRAYRATPHADRFSFVWALLLTVGAVAAVAGLIAAASTFGDPVTRTRTVEVAQPGLSASSTAADAKARFEGQPAQTIDATQIGLQSGVCDVYQLADGGVLVCHP